MNINKIREDFPILSKKIKGHNLVYLDNAATSQKPKQVISAMIDYYENFNANIHRGVYKLSEDSTNMYETAHKKISDFINSDFEEFVFTRGTTESINLVSNILKSRIRKGDEIILSEMEHHSNLVPWQQLAKERKANINFLSLKNNEVDVDQLLSLISNKTKIVSISHMSNVLGSINNISAISKIAHENDAIVIVDGAQSTPHINIDVKKLGCDFFAFSGHKMLGPTGIGGLYGRKDLLEDLPPFMFGGDMIREVSLRKSSWNDLPWKYEAGTPNIAGAIGLSAGLDYLKKIGLDNLANHEKLLSKNVFQRLSETKGLDLYSLDKSRSVFSFNIKGVHPHDAASLFDDKGIALRGGHHCAMPLMKTLGVNGSLRASFYFYNTIEEVEQLIEGINYIKKVFK